MLIAYTKQEINALKPKVTLLVLLLPLSLLLLLLQLKSLIPSFSLSCSLWTTNLDSLFYTTLPQAGTHTYTHTKHRHMYRQADLQANT